MKKTLVRVITFIASFAMIFGLAGCATEENPLKQELEKYENFNHIMTEEGDFKKQWFKEDEFYYPVYSYNKSYQGFMVDVADIHLEEDSEERGTGTSKYTAYLDKYSLTKAKWINPEEQYSYSDILQKVYNYYSSQLEYDIKEEGNKKTFTVTNSDNVKEATIVFEENKITLDNGGEHKKVYSFDNVDNDLYKNFVENVKSLDGATRKQVKEKIGDFVDKYHTEEDY